MRIVNRGSKSGQTAEKIIAAHLDDRFTLVHRVHLRGISSPVDAVLIGPPGVIVLAFAEDTGRVRCLGDNWYNWNDKKQDFDPTPRSPVKRVIESRAAMEAHVNARQMGTTMPIDCAVLIPDSRAQVEYMEPSAAIFPAEHIADLAQDMNGQRELIENHLADDLLKSIGVTPAGQSWRQIQQAAANGQPAPAPRLWGMTRTQIAILAVIAAADLLVLAGGLAVVLMR
jgi:hypothetical protein